MRAHFCCAAAVLVTALVARPAPMRAETPPTDESQSAAAVETPVDPIGTRWVSVSSPWTTPRHNLELIFTHRFLESVQDGSGHDLWGLDSAAAVGLGLTWGVSDRIDLSLLRATAQEDFELAAKAMLLRQSAHVPLTASVRLGVDRPAAQGIADATRPFAQLLLARRFASGWNLMLAPSWIRDTATLRNAWNVPLGFTAPLPRGAMLAFEVVPRNRDAVRDAGRNLGRDPALAWSVAFVKDFGRHITGGHLFKVVIGNSPATTVDQLLGSDPPQSFRRGDVRIGFNLVRDFQL